MSRSADSLTDVRQQRALSIEDIAREFDAEIVDSTESLAEQERFARAWNAQQLEPEHVPIKPRHVGKPYARYRHTSRAAAMEADRMGAMRTRVLEVVRVSGPLTDDAIAFELGTDSNSVRPRRLELLRRGEILEAGKQRTRSGRWAQAWAAL